MRTIIAALIGALALTMALPAAASRLDEAEKAVEAVLDRLGVDRTRIKAIFLSPDAHSQDAPVPSYTGWVSFTDCRGNLVIDLTSTAVPRTIFTTGACRVPGVDGY